MTDGFDSALAISKLRYSGDTRGERDVPMSIRPAALGAATFEFEIAAGGPRFFNIQSIGGEVPGEQTVPRAEAWAATVLLTRVHFNGLARFGIDAAYVTGGMSRRWRLKETKKEGMTT